VSSCHASSLAFRSHLAYSGRQLPRSISCSCTNLVITSIGIETGSCSALRSPANEVPPRSKRSSDHNLTLLLEISADCQGGRLLFGASEREGAPIQETDSWPAVSRASGERGGAWACWYFVLLPAFCHISRCFLCRFTSEWHRVTRLDSGYRVVAMYDLQTPDTDETSVAPSATATPATTTIAPQAQPAPRRSSRRTKAKDAQAAASAPRDQTTASTAILAAPPVASRKQVACVAPPVRARKPVGRQKVTPATDVQGTHAAPAPVQVTAAAPAPVPPRKPVGRQADVTPAAAAPVPPRKSVGRQAEVTPATPAPVPPRKPVGQQHVTPAGAAPVPPRKPVAPQITPATTVAAPSRKPRKPAPRKLAAPAAAPPEQVPHVSIPFVALCVLSL
jgi:hypothetical protein